MSFSFKMTAERNALLEKVAQLETELAALKAGQGEAGAISIALPDDDIAVVIYTEGTDFAREQFFQVRGSDLNPAYYDAEHPMRKECQAATHWISADYLAWLMTAAPPASADARLVPRVPRELLESAIERIELNTHFPFGEPQTPRDAENRRVAEELRARIAELEGAQLLIGELAATIPVSRTLGALETGRTMVDYFKSLHAERDRLHALINNPHTEEWFEGVRLEAAHQVERWGAPHDQGKTAVDWVFLIGHLATKAALAFLGGDITKAKHHTISTAAVCLNWFRAITGETTAMRPGIEEPK